LDPDRRKAVMEFYREELMRHLQQLQGIGIVNDSNRERVRGACDRFLRDLDRVGWRSDMAAMAETLLQRFDTLSRLSEIDSRRGH
jgi:hypothetical protein